MTGMIHNMMHPHTPLLRAGTLLIKHEGASTNPCHKCRLAAFLVWNLVMARGNAARVFVERSSGSMAMGAAAAASACGRRSVFVSNGPPDVFTEAYVTAHGGAFVVVNSNNDRIAALEELMARPGHVSTDQHDAGSAVIEAWSSTLGDEIVDDLRKTVIHPSEIGLLVAAVGTGGTVAGCARALRAAGGRPFVVGADISSSLVSGGPRSFAPLNLRIPGVGSNDERCRTYDIARGYIDELVPVDPISAVEAAVRFFRAFPTGCGLSGGLALAAYEQYGAEICPSGKLALVIFADRADRYSSTIAEVLPLFPNDLEG